MPITIEMPRLSDTMEEGTLLKWNVKVGDQVSAGDHLADVETDKATMELQGFDDGTVAKLIAEEGATLAVGQVIAILAEEGESAEDAVANADAGGAGGSSGGSSGGGSDGGSAGGSGGGAESGSDDAAASESASNGSQSTGESNGPARGQSDSGAAARTAGGKIRVSPLARRLAEEAGLDLKSIRGSGPDGRIIKRDVLEAQKGGGAQETGGGRDARAESGKAASSAMPPAAARPMPAPSAGSTLESKEVTLSGMRKTIAKRLVESKTTIPHFQVTLAIDMDPLLSLRETLNEQLATQNVKLSVNDFVVRACALAILEHPVINTSFGGDKVIYHGTVNIGFAVALPEERGGGLVVPVLKGCEAMGLRQISAETKRLAGKARDTGLSSEEMADGTFAISNLGMFGITQFNAIINPPQTCILAVGAAIERPVVRELEGEKRIVVGHEMDATLSADHRVVDGATAAVYLQTLKRLLENPAALLV